MEGVLTVTGQRSDADGGDDMDSDGGSSASGWTPSHSESGSWMRDAKGWWYQYPDSSYEKGWEGKNSAGESFHQVAWKYINGAWWCFGTDGYLIAGWVWDVSAAAWYYVDENHGLKTGWFRENPEGSWYYLNPETGAMVTDTLLPDGYYVDKSGKWDEKGGA